MDPAPSGPAARPALDDAFERWKAILADQMTPEGRLPHETRRTSSLSDSLCAVNAMVQALAA